MNALRTVPRVALSPRRLPLVARGVAAVIACAVLAAGVTPAQAQIVVGGNGSNTTDSTSYTGAQSLTKIGSNTVTLSGNNTYTGGTVVNAGTLALTGNLANNTNASITVNNGSTFSISRDNFMGGHQSTVLAPIVINSGGTVTGGAYLNTLGAVNLNGGTLTNTGGNAFWGNLAFQLKGTVTASGDVTSTIGGSGSIMLGGDTVNSVTFAVADGAADKDLLVSAQLDNGSGASWPNRQTSSLVKTGDGKMVLGGNNSYSGSTTISAGTLQVGDGGTTGNLGNSSSIINNASLVFNRSDNGLNAGNPISGSGSVTKIGAGTVTLSGNNTYTGGTLINAGTLNLGGGSSTGGNFTIGNGATLQATASSFWFNGTPRFSFTANGGGTIDTSSGVNFIMGGSSTYASAGGAQNLIKGSSGINLNFQTATLDVARGTDATSDLLITSNFWNNGSLVKTGNGIATLAGHSHYSGSTTISAGTLQVGNGGTTGDLGNSSSIINNASLVFNRSDSTTPGNPISGSGSVTKIGAGTVTLSGNNSYTGLTTVNEGTLQLGAGGGTYQQNASDFAINNGSTLAFGGSAYHLNNASTGSPRTITFGAEGGNTLDTKGVNVPDWKGSTYQSRGGSRNAILGLGLNLNAGVVATFNVARGTDPAVDLAVSQVWNGGSIVKNGEGIMTLASAAYSGSTTVNAGTLSIAGGSGTQGSTVSGPVTIGDGATLRVTAQEFWFNGTPRFSFTANGGGTIDTASGVNFVMGGNATYTTAGGSRNEITGSSGINLNSRTATLDVARGTDATSDLHITSNFWNNGSIVKTGNGIVTLSGSNAYTGTTTISQGTLQVGDGGTSGTLGTGNVVNNARLAINRGNAYTLTNIVSGTGELIQRGAGTTTISSSNTHTGGTIVEAGTLLLSGSNRLAPTSSATVNAGGTLRLNGDQTLASIGGSGAITFGTSITGFTLTTGSVSGTFAGSISGAGRLTKVGPGTLTLTGSHSYTAGTIVSAGTLATVGSNVLPTSDNIAVNAGGTLLLGGDQTVGSAGGSGVYNLNGYTLTMTGAAAAFSGDATGGGVLAKSGGGTWRIFGTTSDSTAVVLNGGSIQLMSANRLSDSGAVTVNGGTFDMNGFTDVAGSVTVNGGKIINGTLRAVGVSMNNGTVSGVLTGTGGFTKTSAGTVVISSTSSYTGETAVQGGTLETTGANQLAAGSTMNVSAGGTFKMGGDQALASVAGSGSINLGNGTLTTGSQSSTFAGSLTGNGGLTKVGPGTLTLSGSNAFEGDTTISGGTLVLASAGALPTDAIVTMQSGATLQLSGTTVVGAIENNGGTVAGGTLVASLVATQSGALDSVIADGEVNGTPFAAGILKRGAGTTTVGAVNTFTGAIRLQGGTLELTGSGGFDPASRLVMSSDATMDLNGKSQTFSALTGAGGTVALGSGQLTVNNAAGGVFAGVISGSGGLAKTGAGLLELTGASTYTGATAIDAGELKLNGSLASGALALAAGATLSGTGSIGGNATIAGAHMPGNSPGIQSIGGNLSYSAGSSVTWELTDNTALLADRGVEFDGIDVGGSLAFSGATALNLTFNGSGSLVNWNDDFWTTDKAGASGWLLYDVTGSTTGLSGLAISGTTWLDGAGNSLAAIRPDASFGFEQVGSDVYLTFVAVPEPSSVVLMGLGSAIACLALRRRKRHTSTPERT